MNRDQFLGRWKQLKGRTREQWGRLRDDQVNEIEGRREVLAGRLQEAYGIGKDAARSAHRRRIDHWQAPRRAAANDDDAESRRAHGSIHFGGAD